MLAGRAARCAADGRPGGELPPGLGVPPAPVARGLAAARERLLVGPRAGLRERLGVGAATADSILRELRGRLDVTVTRLLVD